MQNRSRRWSAVLRPLALAAALLAPVTVVAQEGPPPSAGEGGMPDFAAVVKDMQPVQGLFTLYRHRPDDLTKDQTRLIAVIPKSLLRQDLLLATSISRGPMMGYQWNDYLVRWELVGRRLLLSLPDTRYVETPGQPVTDAVRATYTPSFLTALPVLTMTPAGDPVVDLAPLLIGRTVEVPVAAGTEPRRDLSRYTKVKAFPENVLIDVDLAFASRQGPGGTVGVSYAFRRLPDLKSYTPRVADERLGYFTTVRKDWNTKYTERDNVVRYINRWSIRKKDPTLEMSPPDKPITFIIEKSVPLQWRRYVKEGIEQWNAAFEKIGIVGAIVVQQQTDDNEFAEIDPEDARYNFIRWIVTGQPFAMGPSRADPRTGQILDADIIFDDSYLRYSLESASVFGPRGPAAQGGPELLQFMQDNPAFIPLGQDADEVRAAANETFGAGSHEVAPSVVPTRMNPQNRLSACNFAVGLRHQLAFGTAMMLATPTGKKIPEALIGNVIKETIAHEVGHTLGLRHNFKASAWLTLEEIKRRRDATSDATTASVMDYNALLFFPGDEPEKVRYFTTPVIGPYDFWVIEYGYKQPGAGDGPEAEMLKKIAARGTARELAYATDEDVTGPSSVDPDANRWDMAADPLAWAKMRIELADGLLKDIRAWAIQNDTPNYELRDYFSTVAFERVRNFEYVSRIVGGQQFSRNRPKDPEARPALQLLDPAKQREAMQWLTDTAFNDAFFSLDASLLNELVPSRWMDWASTPSSRVDFPAHQMILNMQNRGLQNLLTPPVLQRIYDAELKSTAEDRYTAAEHLQRVQQMVWNDLKLDGTYTDAKPFISSIRRNLQQQHVSYLLAAAESRPGALMSADLQSMIRYSLRELNDQLGELLKQAGAGSGSKLDLASRAHLTEVRSRITRVLDAPAIAMPAAQAPVIIMGSGAAPSSVEVESQQP